MLYQFREKVCISFWVKGWDEKSLSYLFVKAEKTPYIFNRMYLYEAFDMKRKKHLLLAFRAADWKNGEYVPMYKLSHESIRKALDTINIVCHQFDF